MQGGEVEERRGEERGGRREVGGEPLALQWASYGTATGLDWIGLEWCSWYGRNESTKNQDGHCTTQRGVRSQCRYLLSRPSVIASQSSHSVLGVAYSRAKSIPPTDRQPTSSQVSSPLAASRPRVPRVLAVRCEPRLRLRLRLRTCTEVDVDMGPS